MKYLLLVLLLSACGGSSDKTAPVAPAVAAPAEVVAPAPVVEVTNYGVGGYSTESVLRIIDDVAANSHDLAIIMLGTNDSLNTNKIVSQAKYKKNLLYIVDLMLTSGSDVVLMTIPPAIEEYVLDRHSESYFIELSINETINAYNDIVNEVAIERDLVVYDLHSLIMDNGGVYPAVDSYLINEENRDSRDGVHLTTEAYSSVANGLFEMLQDYDYINIAAIGDSITAGVHEIKSYPEYLLELY